MAPVLLASGAYQSASVIANAQRCINLYPEANPQETQPPVPVTHLQTPGMVHKCTIAPGNPVRGVYFSTRGQLYAVVGTGVYTVNANWTFSLIGTMVTSIGPVSMKDNGTQMIIVDGTSVGYYVTLATNAFVTISDVNFYGGNYVDVLDTYFVINRPDSPQFYISESLSVTFNALDFATKAASPDDLATLIVLKRDLILVGTQTGEVWVNAGTADFPFAALPGASFNYGTIAPNSIAAADISAFWISQNEQGKAIVISLTNYQAMRISTHALEVELQSYTEIGDAIGWTQQSGGHTFYWLSFPSANVTWCYDIATKQWHQRAFTDGDGAFLRHRANCCAYAYGQNVVGHINDGSLYVLDPAAYDDYGNDIVRVRGFPHMIANGQRVTYERFIANIEVGTPNGQLSTNPALLSLRWSDTRGASWANPLRKTMGATGQYYTSVNFDRLGEARDRVFELFWSGRHKCSLNGAFVETSNSSS